MSESSPKISRRHLCQAVCGATGLVMLRTLPGCGQKAEEAECGASAVGVGPASAVAVGQALYVTAQDIFVCRDDKGYYAMDAQCTHVGTDINFISASDGFMCPLHGSKFSFDGDVLQGPATLPLPHYELCTTKEGDLVVDLTKQVTEDTRLVV